MTKEAVVLDQDLKLDSRKTPDATTSPCTGKITSDTSALVKSTVHPLIPGSKRNLTERIRGLFWKVTNALEGDHEFHNYLGM